MADGASVGVHLLLNVYRVPNRLLLERLVDGQQILNDIVRDLHLHVVAETGHQFTPSGYTYAYVLSESHFTIHTYPEHQSCYIDIFCCSSTFSPQYAIRCIKTAFQTDHVTSQVITR
jgi:S-adenosylmethionine decarboxylase proenzyme